MAHTAPTAASSQPAGVEEARARARRNSAAPARPRATSARAARPTRLRARRAAARRQQQPRRRRSAATSTGSGCSSGRTHSGCSTVSSENTLPNTKPNAAAASPPGTSRRSTRHAVAHQPAEEREHQALADVAEHVAEHQRHREGEQRARIGAGRARHADQPREDFEGLRPPRIAQHERRPGAARRPRERDDGARAAAARARDHLLRDRRSSR